MIKTRTRMLGNLSGDLAKFEKNVQEKVLISGAAGMAAVIYEEAQHNVAGIEEGMPGVKTGNLKKSIYRKFSEKRSTDNIKKYRVSWDRRIAPHGHLIEFGTSRAPAYPFLTPAFDRINDAIKAGKERMAARLKEIAVES